MAKRRKNRTHKKTKLAGPAPATKSPKSFVIKSSRAHHTSSANHTIRSPHHSTSLNLLVKDFRKVMEPNTASHLRERKSNKFKDFLAMAGPLSVTHIIVFSQSEISAAKQADAQPGQTELISNLNLKIYKVPRGPTLTFKILRFSLMIDILNSDKHPRSPGAEFKTEPLLIMNNFNPDPTATAEDVNRLNLLTTTFRNLFPQIKVHDIHLVQTRRVVLLSYNPVTRTIDFRHYLITVKPVGVSKALRKLVHGVSLLATQANGQKSTKKNKRLLDLGSIEDVAEYLLGRQRGPGSVASSSGFTGAQSLNTDEAGNQSDYDGLSSGQSSDGEDESEGEGNDRKVDLPQNYLGRGNFKNTKKAIRLKEIGPRMEWGLIKIEQGLGSGDVLYHELIKKTKSEDQKIKQKVKEKEKLKAQRRKQQEENVKKKTLEKEAKKQTKKATREDETAADDELETAKGAGGEDDEEGGDEDEDESEIDEDAELSDIFSDLAHSEDEDNLDDDRQEDSDGSADSSSESEPDTSSKTKPNRSNGHSKSRKKTKFSH